MNNEEKLKLMLNGLPLSENGLSHLKKKEKIMKLNQDIANCEKWFSEYDKKISANKRNERLGLSCKYSMVELDIEAQSKQLELHSKRIELNDILI